MRKIVVSEFVTLDGVMEWPGEPEQLDGRGGWAMRYWSEAAGQFKHTELFAAGALLMGRRTYELLAGSWPTLTDDTGFADRMNSLPKYVASTTLKQLAWNNARLIASDLAGEVARLKQQPGQDILVVGSAELAHSLRQHGLIDEYRLMVFPLVLGCGKRLFKDGSDQTGLSLVDARPLDAGAAVLTYRFDPAATKLASG